MEKNQGCPPPMVPTFNEMAPPYPGPPPQPVPGIYGVQPQPVYQPGKTSKTFNYVILPAYFLLYYFNETLFLV